MTRILVVESHGKALEQLFAAMPVGDDYTVEGAQDTDTAEEYMTEAYQDGTAYDVLVVQGAAQTGTSGIGRLSTTLDFLEKLYQIYGSHLRVFVVSNTFDDEPYVSQFQAAYPGCQVYRKAAVLNGAVRLPI